MSISEFIIAMPKAELHVHMEGSIKPETLLILSERNKIKLPYAYPEQIETLFQYKSFEDFVRVYLMFVNCLRTPEDFVDVIFNMGTEMALQNIRYAEITWTPQFYLRLVKSLDIILEAINDGRKTVQDSLGVTIRWIPDLVRSVPGPIKQVLNWCCTSDIKSTGIIALGLGGPEKKFPAALFENIFKRARKAGLPANPHAGENDGPRSVWEAITKLKASRIGHGVRSIEDQHLLDYLIENEITLEVCPTSNIKLGVYKSYSGHPLQGLIEAGCPVTINSDDPVLFRSSLTDEYLHAVNDCGLTLKELENSILQAIRSSYLGDNEKDSFTTSFQNQFAALRHMHKIPPSY